MEAEQPAGTVRVLFPLIVPYCHVKVLVAVVGEFRTRLLFWRRSLMTTGIPVERVAVPLLMFRSSKEVLALVKVTELPSLTSVLPEILYVPPILKTPPPLKLTKPAPEKSQVLAKEMLAAFRVQLPPTEISSVQLEGTVTVITTSLPTTTKGVRSDARSTVRLLPPPPVRVKVLLLVKVPGVVEKERLASAFWSMVKPALLMKLPGLLMWKLPPVQVIGALHPMVVSSVLREKGPGMEAEQPAGTVRVLFPLIVPFCQIKVLVVEVALSRFKMPLPIVSPSMAGRLTFIVTSPELIMA